jgi:DNA-damage-inducible protein J
MSSTMVHVRIDETIKQQASETLQAMGLSLSDAVRVFLTRVVSDQKIPFELRVPNEHTQSSMVNSESGIDVHSVKDAKDMFNQLGI